MVVLRAIVARGQARRQHAFFGKEPLLDFLFPDGQQPYLPDELFSVITRYYWGGEP